jgi:hypothetical protein
MMLFHFVKIHPQSPDTLQRVLYTDVHGKQLHPGIKKSADLADLTPKYKGQQKDWPYM